MAVRRLWLGGALIAVAVATAAVVVLAGRDSGQARTAPAMPLRAEGTISPRIAVFGDTIRAQVDVTFDRRRVDPSSVRVQAGFNAWRRVGQDQLVRSDAGNTSYLRALFVLRCLKLPCTPGRDTIVFDFDPARVEFEDRVGGKSEQKSVPVSWPQVTIHTRIRPGELTARASPYRADLATVPKPSYRTSPGRLLALLIALCVALALAGIALAYFGWPRRAPAAEPEPEPESAGDPTLSPLEQALELLENAASANGAADQRRSLELVAEVLADRGEDDGLVRTARELAWSPTPPPVAATKGLATRVRAALEEELRQLELERLRLEEELDAAAAREETRAEPV
jgi:hypothetical protein